MCHCRRRLDLIAVRLRARRLQPPVGRSLVPVDDPAQHHFDAIIGYENLPITALRGQLPAV